MSTNGSNGSNGHGSNGHNKHGVDMGLREETERTCCRRLDHGGWCTLVEKHQGECIGIPLRHEHPQRAVDWRIKAKPVVQKPAEQKDVKVTWPEVGSKFVDDAGRTLTVTEVAPKAFNERHIVGVLDDNSKYACSRILFDVIWRAP